MNKKQERRSQFFDEVGVACTHIPLQTNIGKAVAATQREERLRKRNGGVVTVTCAYFERGRAEASPAIKFGHLTTYPCSGSEHCQKLSGLPSSVHRSKHAYSALCFLFNFEREIKAEHLFLNSCNILVRVLLQKNNNLTRINHVWRKFSSHEICFFEMFCFTGWGDHRTLR